MSKTYQKNRRAGQAAMPPAEVAVPEQVIVSMAQIAESAREGLLSLAVSTGLQVMTAMFEEDVTALCGPQSKHNADRAGYRHDQFRRRPVPAGCRGGRIPARPDPVFHLLAAQLSTCPRRLGLHVRPAGRSGFPAAAGLRG